MPQSQVFDAMQDSRGYLWYGTQGGGIARFDGLGFKVFTTKDSLLSNYVNIIHEDVIGQIWAGTTHGLSYYDGRKWTPVVLPNGQPIHVHTLLQISDSIIWVGTGNGVYAYSNTTRQLTKLSFDSRLDELGINDLLKTEKGVLVASNSGLWHILIAGDKIERFTSRDGLNGSVIQSLMKDDKGLIWVAAYNGGLSVFDEKKNLFLPFENPPRLEKSLTLFLGEKNDIWVGTRDQGISIYHQNDSTWTYIDENKGLPHNHVKKIFKDSWNNIWICTSGGGVAKYLGQFFVQFNNANGLHGKYIYALANDDTGKLWVSASNNGLAAWNGNRFEKSQIDSGYINVKSKTILSTTDGLWVGTEGKGVIRIDSSGYQTFTTKEGLSGNWVRRMVEDDEGNIWVATQAKGIVKIEKNGGGDYKLIRHKTDLPDLYLSTIVKSPKGRIWFATKLGKLGYFDGDKVQQVFGKKSGLPNVAIRAIVFDSLERIWLGTAGHGIYIGDLQSDSISFQKFQSEQQLYSDNIYLLAFDRESNLWAGNEAGVDKILLNEVGTALDIRHFGRNEGFSGMETCQNAVLLDDNGDLWFGTMNGLMKHSPSKEIQTLSTPTIHFTKVSLFYQPLSETKYHEYARADGGLKEGLQLPYNENHLNFEFKALNLSNPRSIKYRWRLLGSVSGWSPFSTKESVDYSNLLPGDYTFEVQAKSGDENFSEVLSTSFFVKKPFWQLLWVQLLSSFLLLGLLFLLAYNWKRKVLIRESIKREDLEVKNHILQLEQKALQLQMNPHFIFNALNSIQSLVATKDLKTARTQINNFATMMRGILSNSKQEKISLEQEIKVLQKYLEIEQFCQRIPFEFEIIIGEHLKVDEIEIPPMILQPFVENAVIHGISHRQDKGRITIAFSLTGALLCCSINDNGVGRKRAEALKQSRKPGHQSISMEVTRERLEALKGTSDQYIPLVTKDLLSIEGAVCGTQVKVTIPVVVWN